MNVFITRPIPESGLQLLREAGHTVRLSATDAPLPAETLRAGLSGADAVITMLSDKITADVLAENPQLQIVTQFAVGFDNIDVQAATARGVSVCNTPDVLTDATADLAWALLLAAARRVVEGDRYVRSGQWDGWGPMQLLGTKVSGKTLGIVGAGRIGQAIGRRALGFQMPVLYNARYVKPEFEAEVGAQWRDLDDLLRESDFISISCPLTPETRHLIDARRLELMKPSAVLVNTARGPVVDEEALAMALRSRKIAAAGLDVFEKEPEIHPDLMGLDNVVMLPHAGSGDVETREVMSELCARNIIAHFRGEEPPTLLNPKSTPPGFE